MRILSIPVLAVAMLASASVLAGPALAQSSADTTTNNQTGSQVSPQKTPAEMQSQLRQSLEKSGFKNIQIRPEAYVVHAQAQDGTHLVMMISPDEVQGMVVQGSGSSSAPRSTEPSGSNSTGTKSDTMGNSGTSGTSH